MLETNTGRSALLFFVILLAGATLTFAQGPDMTRGPHHLGHLVADLDADGDGSVSREEFDQGADVIFGELDQNGDGVLSSDELPRFKGPRHGRGPGRGKMAGAIVARAADGDGDGAVASDEWQAFLDSLEIEADGSIAEDSLRAALPFGRKGTAEVPGSEMRRGGPPSGALSRMLDRDGDALLEIDDLSTVFAELDADGDGALQAEELPRFRGRRGPPSR